MAIEMNRRFGRGIFSDYSMSAGVHFSESIEAYERLSALAKRATISRMEEFSACHEEKQEFIGAGNDFSIRNFLRNSVFVSRWFFSSSHA
jgi:hypothetical protein